MDESSELTALLRSAEGPREFSAPELERLTARIGAAAPMPVDDDVIEIVRPRPNEPRRPGWWMAAAAAAIVAVVSLVVLVGRRDEVLAPTSPSLPTESLPAAPAAWCDASFVPLVDALSRWRGLENWAWTGGTPDVGELSADALRSLVDVAPAELGAEAATAADQLEAVLAAIEDAGLDQRTSAANREAAVAPALDVLTELAADQGLRCDVAALDAVR